MRNFFSLTLSAVVVLLISGFVSLKPIHLDPIVLASHSGNCVDIQKVDGKDLTDAIYSDGSDGSEPGISDSGQMDFDDPDTSTSYHGCVERTQRTRTLPAPSGAVTGNFWSGWVWNSNIGYISFNCEGGVNPNPGGSSCGAVPYGTLSSLNGDVSGFAWADNIGWISMGCTSGQNLGVSCGAVNYGVRTAQQDGYDPSTDLTNPVSCARNENNNGPAGTLNAGDFYGYGWNDSVGWINFCGASARYSYSAQVSVARVSYATGAALAPGATIYANGDDAYEVRLRILDENGTPMVFEGNPSYRVDIVPQIGGTGGVRKDQITPCTLGPSSCEAILTTSFATGLGANWDATNQWYYNRIASVAPTGASDSYILDGIAIRIFDPVGTPAPQTGDDVLLHAIDVIRNDSFTFAPPLEVTQIESEESPGVYSTSGFSTIANTSQRIRLTIGGPGMQNGWGAGPYSGPAFVHTYVYDCSNQYDFVFDQGGDGYNPAVDLADTPAPPPNRGATVAERNSYYCGNPAPSQGRFADTATMSVGIDFGNPSPYFASAQGNQYIYTVTQGSGSNQQIDDALAFDTAISYTVGSSNVRYLSRSLTNSSVLSQAADVRGDVSIDIRDTTGLPASDRISQSIGERAQSKREPVYRVIRSSLASRTPGAFTTGSNRQILNAAQLVSTPANKGIIYYRRDRTVLPAAPCSIILESADGSTMSVNSGVTLMTEGCDIYIDHNIVTGSNGQLGIIALEDLSMPGNRKGGNVYICSQVSDAEANFVLDGSVFSYGNVSDCGDPSVKTALVNATTGYPIFTSSVRDVLRNQLTIVGSLVSNNTYGGSLQNPPLTGTGEIATGSEVASARLFDLNFLRYAKTRSNPIDPVDGPPCWANGPGAADTVTLSTSITQGSLTADQVCNDLTNPNNSWTRGIVNIIYEAPSKTLPIFNAVK